MQGPADTLNYMLAGYGIIFGVMLIYIISLFIRARNLRQDEEILEQLQEKQAPRVQK
jgi:hypothetical protein